MKIERIKSTVAEKRAMANAIVTAEKNAATIDYLAIMVGIDIPTEDSTMEGDNINHEQEL